MLLRSFCRRSTGQMDFSELFMFQQRDRYNLKLKPEIPGNLTCLFPCRSRYDRTVKKNAMALISKNCKRYCREKCAVDTSGNATSIEPRCLIFSSRILSLSLGSWRYLETYRNLIRNSILFAGPFRSSTAPLMNRESFRTGSHLPHVTGGRCHRSS